VSGKQNINKDNKQNNTKGRSQRRLALALLLVLILGIFLFMVSKDPVVSGLRNELLGNSDTQTEEENSSDQNEGQSSAPDNGAETAGSGTASGGTPALSSKDLPEYNGSNYIEVNGNYPEFDASVYAQAGLVYENGKLSTEGSKTGKIDSSKLMPYEYYGELDKLGRCTVAYGCLGEETMPDREAERGDISRIHPSGWAKAQNWERCHLIAWALSAENANERNLVTGTHYMNYDGMRPLEEEVEHYIWDTGNHVLYLSRPYFYGKELVPRGVQMIARSVEDNGRAISFNVYCFNVTPGSTIDYTNGVVTTEEQANQDARKYVINTRSGVFHYPSCDGAKSMSSHNRKVVTATRSELTAQGYMPCGACEP